MTDDLQRRARRSKRRGMRGEYEVRDLLRTHGFEAHRKSLRDGRDAGDIDHTIPDWHLEVKCVERLDLHGAWRQANAAKRVTDSVMVCHRGNNQPWLATVLLTDFMACDQAAWAWSPMVLSPRQALRAELLGRLRVHSHPLAVHTVCDEAVVTVLLDDLLFLLELERENQSKETAA